MIEFFTSAEVTTSQKLLEILFFIIGFIAFYTGIKNLRDKENASPVGTAVFWCSMGIVIALGRWIPNTVNGAIIVLMTIPAMLKKVKIGKVNAPTAEETKAAFAKNGMKIFIPSLAIGVCAISFAIFTKLGALVGVGCGVFVAIVLLMIFSRENTPKVFLGDAERLLTVVGPLSTLPMLLASLGAIFTAAGVGEVIASIIGNVIPQGNMTIGIIVFAISMPLFTMIMGNAFAAITVMTVGIGAPFELALGADPTVIGMLALTCGYCGTLCTPMAANFNIVPVAMLDMKDRFGVIKNQVIPAVIILAFQICYMLLFK